MTVSGDILACRVFHSILYFLRSVTVNGAAALEVNGSHLDRLPTCLQVRNEHSDVSGAEKVLLGGYRVSYYKLVARLNKRHLYVWRVAHSRGESTIVTGKCLNEEK